MKKLITFLLLFMLSLSIQAQCQYLEGDSIKKIPRICVFGTKYIYEVNSTRYKVYMLRDRRTFIIYKKSPEGIKYTKKLIMIESRPPELKEESPNNDY